MEQEVRQDEEDDAPLRVRLVGPATMLPPYMPIAAKSKLKGEGHMSALYSSYLPQEAIDLMIRRPADELIQRRAVWFPTDRFGSKGSIFDRPAHWTRARGVSSVFRPPTDLRNGGGLRWRPDHHPKQTPQRRLPRSGDEVESGAAEANQESA